MPVLRVEHVEVGERCVEAVVRVLDPAAVRTRAVPGLATRALALLPGLARHTCENSTGKAFELELADTQTAHLLEHVTVELMALAGSPRDLHAHTSWDFAADGRGVYRVAFAYDHDLVALGALKEAAAIVEALVGAGQPVDIGAVVARLAELRGR